MHLLGEVLAQIESGKATFALVNAILNGIATVLLVIALVAIKRGDWRTHGKFMIAALTTSAAFLICYVVSKILYGEKSTALPPSLLRTIYFSILIPHVLLAIAMLPPILMLVYLAWKRSWAAHRKLAKFTYPVWLFVSVTGVVVYILLYQVFPVMYPQG
jgi:uncharacterized membrane protein YozB (DUF420 family)